MMYTSISEIKQFLACRRTWYWSGRNAMYLKSGDDNEALRLGSAFHDGLELMYAREPVDLKELQEKYSIGDTSMEMLSFQLRQYREITLTQDLEKYEIVEPEMKYEVQINENTILFGYIDIVYRNKENGKYGVLEHKFVGRPRADRYNELDEQVKAYEYAVKEKYGYDNFDKVIVNQIIKSPKNYRNIRSEHSQSIEQLVHFKNNLIRTTNEMRLQAREPIVYYSPNWASVMFDPYYELNKKMDLLGTNDTRVITDEDIKKAGLTERK